MGEGYFLDTSAVFVCSDQKLLRVAREYDLVVINPDDKLAGV